MQCRLSFSSQHALQLMLSIITYKCDKQKKIYTLQPWLTEDLWRSWPSLSASESHKKEDLQRWLTLDWWWFWRSPSPCFSLSWSFSSMTLRTGVHRYSPHQPVPKDTLPNFFMSLPLTNHPMQPILIWNVSQTGVHGIIQPLGEYSHIANNLKTCRSNNQLQPLIGLQSIKFGTSSKPLDFQQQKFVIQNYWLLLL